MQTTLQESPLSSPLGYNVSWSKDRAEIERSWVCLRRVQIVSWRQRMVVQRALHRGGYTIYDSISIDVERYIRAGDVNTLLLTTYPSTYGQQPQHDQCDDPHFFW